MSTIERTDAMKLFDYGIQSMRAQSIKHKKKMDFGYKILIKNLINACCYIFNFPVCFRCDWTQVENGWNQAEPMVACKRKMAR